ncbi:MAG: hypothetical protein EPO61_14990 [Nitrospirae bacterium]|nr:MAG: hypothetical protein EPO61_14990 [Nitrospirota bacterium]
MMGTNRCIDRTGPTRLLSPLLLVLLYGVVATWLLIDAGQASAAHVVEVPVLSAVNFNNKGAFQVMVISWDQQATPDPVEAKWGNNRVRVKGTALDALGKAFFYAVRQSDSLHPTGTISIYGAAYAPVSNDGPSAGAAMAIGFLAVLRGDPILRGVALTGTLQPEGRIGPVGAIPDKVRATAREGYRTILIPQGQLDNGRFSDPKWNLNGLAMELGLTIKEVATIAEAYELMTGRRL